MLRPLGYRRIVLRQAAATWQSNDKNEIGFPVCSVNDELIPGKQCEGTRLGVSIPVLCTRGKPIALFHTHPGGVAEPSQADIREGYRHKVAICIGVPETGEIKCYKSVSPTKAIDLSK